MQWELAIPRRVRAPIRTRPMVRRAMITMPARNWILAKQVFAAAPIQSYALHPTNAITSASATPSRVCAPIRSSRTVRLVMIAMPVRNRIHANLVPAKVPIPLFARLPTNAMTLGCVMPRRVCARIRRKPTALHAMTAMRAHRRIRAPQAHVAAAIRSRARRPTNATMRVCAILLRACVPIRTRRTAVRVTIAICVHKRIPAKQVPAPAQWPLRAPRKTNVTTSERVTRQTACVTTRPNPMVRPAKMASAKLASANPTERAAQVEQPAAVHPAAPVARRPKEALEVRPQEAMARAAAHPSLARATAT